MGQAKRRKELGLMPQPFLKVFYKGRILSHRKTKWIIENHPESLRRMES